jgi:hypothetical protein
MPPPWPPGNSVSAGELIVYIPHAQYNYLQQDLLCAACGEVESHTAAVFFVAANFDLPLTLLGSSFTIKMPFLQYIEELEAYATTGQITITFTLLEEGVVPP